MLRPFFIEKKGGGLANPTALLNREPYKGISRNGAMVISFSVELKKLFELGRDYPWPRPDSCSRCSSYRLWGHGFVSAYFDGYAQPLTLKRYRCPDCGCVIRLRPAGYFRRFQASITVIRSSIVSKVSKSKWIGGINRERQRHWFRSLCRKITAHLTNAWSQGIVAGFDRLWQMGQIPVSRAI